MKGELNNAWNDMQNKLDNFESNNSESEWTHNDDVVYYKPELRWNKNIKEARVKECWDCGKETSDYWHHTWRTQDGRISMYKCAECYEKILRIKERKNEEGYNG